MFRLVSNTEDITFNSNLYTAADFIIEFPNESAKGDLSFGTIKIRNINTIIRPLVEETKGGIGATVRIIIVNSAYLTENYSELDTTFDVVQSSLNPLYVNIKLGYRNLMLVRYPLYRYIPNHCNWLFKSPMCAYTGTDITCDRNLNACRQKNNSSRFGGYLGLQGGGIKVV